jgi:hypothetical protein
VRGHVVVVFAAALLLFHAAAGQASVGLGIMAGQPTGVSLKVWTNSEKAFDLAAGWSLEEHEWFYLHGDFLWHSYELDAEEFDGTIPYYLGIGARLLLRDERDSKLGIRIPVGLDYVFGEQPFDVFVEFAPILDLVPETELDWSGAIGIRYYF